MVNYYEDEQGFRRCAETDVICEDCECEECRADMRGVNDEMNYEIEKDIFYSKLNGEY